MALAIKNFATAQRHVLQSFQDTSASGAILTVVTASDDGRPFKLISIHVRYSVAVTKTATVVKTGFADESLPDIVLTAEVEGSFRPGDGHVFLGTDVITVVAPAEGGQTSTIEVIQEAI